MATAEQIKQPDDNYYKFRVKDFLLNPKDLPEKEKSSRLWSDYKEETLINQDFSHTGEECQLKTIKLVLVLWFDISVLSSYVCSGVLLHSLFFVPWLIGVVSRPTLCGHIIGHRNGDFPKKICHWLFFANILEANLLFLLYSTTVA
ncbi:hypothetical protein AMECASPLE_012131 [Ameca splendens]|uniref:Uncharacterized protein n=1 Tax=Ameca splendens TaxID=208324 RepID=A0ABV0XQ16_9TELE